MPDISSKIKILHPSIDDYQNTVVIRGVLDNDSLSSLKTDYYQRELLPSASRKNIRNAIESGTRLPDIVLGMRGETFTLDENANLYLDDLVYIIDGQQRVKTLLEMLSDSTSLRLGAVVHLNTNPIWERELFQKLNQFQVKVSPNILLRNLKEDHPLVTTLYGLSNTDKQFVLYDRISWSQNMKRNDLLSAATLLQVILRLHSHLVPGRSTGVKYLVSNSDLLIKRIGLPATRANIKTLFDTIDSCWGIRRIQIKGGAPYMRKTFLEVFSRILSDHKEFWKGDREQRLEVDYTIKNKLRSFPMTDPEIMRLCSTSGAARLTLYTHILNHINSGRRLHRLTSRKPAITFNIEEETENENEDEGEAA